MNLRFGNKLFGRYIWAASVKKAKRARAGA